MRRLISVYYTHSNGKQYIATGMDGGICEEKEKGDCLRVVFIHKVNEPSRDRHISIPVKSILSKHNLGNLSYYERGY